MRPLELRTIADWRVKRYLITTPSRPLDTELVAAADELTASALPSPADADERHGVGLVVVHQGDDANYVLVNWWWWDVVLRGRAWTSPIDRPAGLMPMEPDAGPCIWELAVLDFERRAWTERVLRPEHGPPDLDAYLTARMREAW